MILYKKIFLLLCCGSILHSMERQEAPVARIDMRKNRDLLDAVARGDLLTVNRLLDEGTDVDVIGDHGLSALAVAINSGNMLISELLLIHGAECDADLLGLYLASDLLKAVIKGDERAIAQTQIKCNPDPQDLERALWYAVGQGHSAIVQHFLAGGAIGQVITSLRIVERILKRPSVNIKKVASYRKIKQLLEEYRKVHGDPENELLQMISQTQELSVTSGAIDSSFDLALQKGDTEMACLLLKYGAHCPPNSLKNIILDQLCLRAALGDYTMVEVLLATEQKKENIEEALLYAIGQKRENVISLLLKKLGKATDKIMQHADIVMQKAEGESRKKAEMIKKILLTSLNSPAAVAPKVAEHDNGQSQSVVNVRGPRGRTLLHEAVIKKDEKQVMRLLDLKADVNLTDDNNGTALHMAAFTGNVLIVQLLLRHKASVMVFDKNKRTPLHIAAAKGNIEIVKELLAVGAEVDVRDNKGKSALDDALEGKMAEVIMLLLRYGSPVDAECMKLLLPPLSYHAAQGQIDEVRTLLLETQSQEDKDQALLYATSYGRIDIVKMLLGHGAEPHDALATITHILRRESLVQQQGQHDIYGIILSLLMEKKHIQNMNAHSLFATNSQDIDAELYS